MEKIFWEEKYSVGVTAFDRDHQNLFSALNHLQESINTENSAEVISEILGGLVQYARIHFAAEENFMKIGGYPGFKAHAKSHRILLKRVVEFCGRATYGTDQVMLELCEFLEGWLKNHILEEDLKYGEYFHQQGLFDK